MRLNSLDTSTPVDPVADWLFRINCAGPFATDEEIGALIQDAPDPDHEMVAYLWAQLDARFIASLAAA